MPAIEIDFWAELVQIQAKSISWNRLVEGAHHHLRFNESSDNIKKSSWPGIPPIS
jgi:hypothetical protein